MDLDKTYTDVLTAIGLSEKEQQLYIAALRLGKATVQELADTSGVNRSTVYLYLDRMKEKGVLHELIIKKKRIFSPESPASLQEKMVLVKQQVQDQLSTIEAAEGALPFAIQSLQKMSESSGNQQPNVWMYEGIDGIKDSYRHILSHATDEVLSLFSVMESEQPALQRFFQVEYSPERAARGIHSRNITTQTPKVSWFTQYMKELNMEIRFGAVPNMDLLNAEINLYGDYLHAMHFNDKTGSAIIIRNPLIVSLQRHLFECAWASARAIT